MSDGNINNELENELKDKIAMAEITEERKPISKIINDSAKTGDLATPEDFTDPEEIYKVLIDKIKSYHPSDDFDLIEKED